MSEQWGEAWDGREFVQLLLACDLGHSFPSVPLIAAEAVLGLPAHLQ